MSSASQRIAWLAAQESRRSVSQFLSHQTPAALEGTSAKLDARKLLPEMEETVNFTTRASAPSAWATRRKSIAEELPDYSPRDFD